MELGWKGTDESRVVVRVPLVHGDGPAADDEEAEVAVLVSDGVDAEVVHPPGVLRRAPPAAPAAAAEVRRPRLRELHLGHVPGARRHRRRGRLRSGRGGHLGGRGGWVDPDGGKGGR